MNYFRAIFALLLSPLFLSFSVFFISSTKAETLKIWISTSVEQNIVSKIREPFEKATGIKIEVPGDTKSISGPDYMKDVLDGKVEAGTNSQSFSEWSSETKNKYGFSDEQIKTLTHRVIGHDIMKIFCNKGVGIKKLNSVHLESIFSGDKKNWKDLGINGADVSIQIVFPSKVKTTTFSAFRKIVLNKREYGMNLIDVKTYEEMVDKVNSTNGTCGFGPNGIKIKEAVEIETPVIGRPSTLITKGKPNEKVQKLIDFIHTEGPKYGVK